MHYSPHRISIEGDPPSFPHNSIRLTCLVFLFGSQISRKPFGVIVFACYIYAKSWGLDLLTLMLEWWNAGMFTHQVALVLKNPERASRCPPKKFARGVALGRER